MNEKEISKLIDKFDHSSLNELRIDNGSSTIYFNKGNQNSSNEGNKEFIDNNDENEDVSNDQGKSDSKPVEKQTKTEKPANTESIKAPLVGIVYFAPSPEKPDFKAVGDHVKKGETVCEIEAMKVLNDVKSPVDGTIKKRLVENGSMVEYQQAIFEIEAD